MSSTTLRWSIVGAAILFVGGCSGSDGSGATPARRLHPVIDRVARNQPGRSTVSLDPKCQASAPPTATGRPEPLGLHLLWDAKVGVNRFSSPTIADLDGDGALDVVVAGGVQNKTGSVTALAGATGRPLWQREFPDELYTTPLALKVNADAALDVVVGGRIKDELALDGRTGATLWSLVGVNPGLQTGNAATGTATATPDIDGDGTRDLVFTQSGDSGDRDPRPPGLFHFVSGATGHLDFTFVAPDSREVYSVPTVQADPLGRPVLDLIYGSGGATLPGHLTKIRVPFTGSTPTVPRIWEYASEPLGITSAPIVTTGTDGRSDVIATQFEGHALRLAAADGTVCWRTKRLPGVLPTTAAVGRFAGLAGPGVVVKTLGGQGVLLWFDGRDGRIGAQARVGAESWASPLTADLNGDGLDEVILSAVTDVPPGGFETPSARANTHVLIFDGRTRRVLIDRVLSGWSSATPTLADLDLDGHADLLVPHFDRLARFSVQGTQSPSTTVNQYRGPKGDGVVPMVP